MENDMAEKWRKTLNKVFRAVVVPQVACTRAFDTEVESSSDDTGFVVDKTRGIILTNRRVVNPGPVVADARFLNREEIPVYPLYRDPVHDFGFFRFDPAALQFMECEEIPLAPEAAVVGLDIRLVGNGGDGSLSIMTGTLDRVNREAPHYTDNGYNDFNTFYMQAASRIYGGTRGAPVVDCDGRAVALNCSGKDGSCTAFFLPLDKVQRALRIIQNCKDFSAVHIPRGTLQMTLVHKGFDEARRSGLQWETEELTRQSCPSETGVLVIASVVPGGPATDHLTPLKAGDLLVRVNDEIVTQFLRLETLLDDNVGENIDLEVERGGEPLMVTLEVQDLHTITPHYFLEISGGVIHPLSYQQARNFRFECGLPYVAKPGFMLAKAGVPPHAIILQLSGQKVSSVEDFISIFSELSRGSYVSLEIMTESGVIMTVTMIVDMHDWYAEPELYTRDDVTGLWNKRPAMLPFTCSAIEPDGQGDNTCSAFEPDGQGDNTYSPLEPDWEGDNTCSAIEPDGEGENTYSSLEPDWQGDNTCSAIEPDGQGDNTCSAIEPDGQGDNTCSAIEPDGQGDNSYSSLETDSQGDNSYSSLETDSQEDNSYSSLETDCQGDNTCSASEPDGQGDNTCSAIEPDGQGDNSYSSLETDWQGDNSYSSLETDWQGDNTCSAIEPDGQGDSTCSPLEPDWQGDNTCSAIEPDGQGDNSSEVLHENKSDSESLVSKASFAADKVTEPSLVTVRVDIPACSMIYGVNQSFFEATGVVIYQSNTVGIVAVDKFTVPVCVSDIRLTFAAYQVGVHGEVFFLHPIHNYALISYNPAALGPSGASAIRVASLLPEPVLRVGDAVYHVSLVHTLNAKSLKCIVTKPKAFNNIEAIKVDSNFGVDDSGVLVDEQGNVQALWGRFSSNEIGGIPIYAISEVLHKIINGTPDAQPLLINGIKMCKPSVRILEVELAPILLLNARGFGLGDNWIKKLAPIIGYVFQVRICWAGSSAAYSLQPGDMLLAIDGKPITNFRDIENACQRCKDDEGKLRITVFREGSEMELLVGTDVTDGFGPKHIVSWCGSVVHEPLIAIRQLGFFPEEGYGVYVSCGLDENAGINNDQWIVEINGKPIPDLQIFKDIIKELKDGEVVRVKTIGLSGATYVFTLKQEFHYSPTWELIFEPETASWVRKTIKTNL